jgi:FkbM family methyltransferase
MKLRRRLIDLLDRPGGRRILGALSTLYARAHGAPVGARIYFDEGAWIRTDGGDRSSVDASRYEYWSVPLRDFQREFEAIWTAPAETWLWQYRPSPGDVIVDVGAGVGHDSLQFARLAGPGSVVLAIEAHPGTFHMLELAVKLNQTTQIRPRQVAVLAESGEVFIEDRPGHMENRVTATDVAGRGFRVRGQTMDEIVLAEGLDRIDFLKMNIEGAERLAIKGMSATLSRTSKVCIACHDFLYRQTGDEWYRTKDLVSAYLVEQGFDVSVRMDDPNEPIRDQVHGSRRG